MKNKLLDILIPTFNRSNDLEKNLCLLSNIIDSNCLQESINIIVSDNCSSDLTKNVCEKYSTNYPYIFYIESDKNVGLEKNAVKVLDHASSKFVMYLGDDDYLPNNYLIEVIDSLKSMSIGSIIPGGVEVFEDGTKVISRDENFKKKKFRRGYITVLKLVFYGHQLSGLVLRRQSLLQKYTEKDNLRNLYPFITFLGINLKLYSSLYIPKYKVEITQYNAKDWDYDYSGLLFDIFKNFRILYPNNVFAVSLLEIGIMLKQYRRVRVKNLKVILKTLRVFCKSPHMSIITKILFPFILIIVIIKKVNAKYMLTDK